MQSFQLTELKRGYSEDNGVSIMGIFVASLTSLSFEQVQFGDKFQHYTFANYRATLPPPSSTLTPQLNAEHL